MKREADKRAQLKKLNYDAEQEVQRLGKELRAELATTADLTRQNSKLTGQVEKQGARSEQLSAAIKELEKSYKELDEQYDAKKGQCLESERDNKRLRSFLSKLTVISQMQRSLANGLVQGVNSARNVLSVVQLL